MTWPGQTIASEYPLHLSPTEALARLWLHALLEAVLGRQSTFQSSRWEPNLKLKLDTQLKNEIQFQKQKHWSLTHLRIRTIAHYYFEYLGLSFYLFFVPESVVFHTNQKQLCQVRIERIACCIISLLSKHTERKLAKNRWLLWWRDCESGRGWLNTLSYTHTHIHYIQPKQSAESLAVI